MAKRKSKKTGKQQVRKKLIDAIGTGNLELAQDLVDQGAYAENDDDIRLALEKNAKQKHKKMSELLEAASLDLNNQLLKAAGIGDDGSVRDLVARGAHLGSTDKTGKTAWELAATAGHDTVVKVLKDAVVEMGELLANPESGDSQRAPCPICGNFYVVNDGFDWEIPGCGHFVGATYGNFMGKEYIHGILDEIIFDAANAVEEYIDEGGDQEDAPKGIGPIIESMVDYGNEWWGGTKSNGIKAGISIEVDEYLNSSWYASFFHADPELFARKHRDLATKVMKWLEKQGYESG